MALLEAGSTTEILTEKHVSALIASSVEHLQPEGKSFLFIIPDLTRTCPLPMMIKHLYDHIGKRAKQFDLLIALGTHPALTEEQIDQLLGVDPGSRETAYPNMRVFNHDWKSPDALTKIGTLTAETVEEITGGLFSQDIDVTLNKLALQYDKVVVCGPVFPHEVVGFSGGAKYFFPGICGEELLNFFHWLGAVITCPKIIGNKWTPVRKLLHAALGMIPADTAAFCMVGKGHDLAGLFFDSVAEAWSAAADLSDQLHITYVDKPFRSILSRAPLMYDEIWVAAKCMYKMEPVVADGGELIIYAPHVEEISVTHGKLIREIGYHTRDYFVNQWEKFKDYPWGVLAHSTHVRGIGRWVDGAEQPRIKVTLATRIPKDVCDAVNLGYRDPESIDVSQWEGREAEGKLYVPKAGEMLYKLKNGPSWQVAD
ncbi:MAG: lactate racemase domain-containing protein [Phycisphaerae bacterium]